MVENVPFILGSDIVEELKKKVEKPPKQDKESEELRALILEKGLIEGTLEYLRRHPEKLDWAVENLKRELRENGESEENIQKIERIIRAIQTAYNQTH